MDNEATVKQNIIWKDKIIEGMSAQVDKIVEEAKNEINEV